ncbi:MAG: Ankyrin, partial [Verrucomicrobiales bacterium]|nr:Ankyrin [Verrucomicrobiales bacterium]
HDDIRKIKVTVADARSVVARWYGFENWSKLTKHIEALTRKESRVLQFELAVEAIINGDLGTLKALLREYPELVEARSTREHQATLLHYVAANGVEDYRQKTPKNAVKVATVLIEAGAEVDADLDYGLEGRKSYPERLGSTTLGLVATSFHPAKAGVQIALLETLLQAGARIDGIPGGWNPLVAALHNGRGDAAACLARNGANLDLEGAAGVGCLEPVKKYLRPDGSLKQIATFSQLNHGFLWACEYGRTEVVKFLAKRVPQLCARRIHGATGLHQAAYGGHSDVGSALLKRGAPVNIIDEHHNGTPLGWALYAWSDPPPEFARGRYHEVVELLVKAGATMDTAWIEDSARAHPIAAKIRADPRMSAALKTIRRYDLIEHENKGAEA